MSETAMPTPGRKIPRPITFATTSSQPVARPSAPARTSAAPNRMPPTAESTYPNTNDGAHVPVRREHPVTRRDVRRLVCRARRGVATREREHLEARVRAEEEDGAHQPCGGAEERRRRRGPMDEQEQGKDDRNGEDLLHHHEQVEAEEPDDRALD